MRYARALLLLLLPLVVVVSSCSNREEAKVAEFKDRSITIDRFEKAYSRVDPVFLPKATGFEGKLEFLTTMLNKEVMAYKADELGYDKDPSVVQGMEAFMKMGLQAGYMKKMVVDRVTVSEDEVKAHYALKGVTLTVKQMLLDTLGEADMVWSRLENGENFETLLRAHSKTPGAESGGQATTMTYGSVAPTIQAELFKLDVGGYTPPLHSSYGYFIFKVLKREQTKKKESYEDNYARWEQEVRVIKEMLENIKVTDEIRERYGVSWYEDGVRVCFDALPPDRPLNNPPRRQDEVYPLLYFDDVDLDKPVVEYNNKTISVKDFSDFYDQASFFNRPRRAHRHGGLRLFLRERIMSDIIPEEMRKSNIAEDPEIAAAIRGKREELMVNRLYADMVDKQTIVSEREIQNYYQDNLEAFKVPEKRRFGVILCGDKAGADQAYAELKEGELFRTVAMTYSIDETTRQSRGETQLMAEGEQAEIDKVGFTLPRVGSVSEPFETSRGWMVLKLTERQPPRTYTLEEARASIQSAIKQDGNEKRLNELLDKWKEELAVVIHEDNLRKTEIQERSAAGEAASATRR